MTEAARAGDADDRELQADLTQTHDLADRVRQGEERGLRAKLQRLRQFIADIDKASSLGAAASSAAAATAAAQQQAADQSSGAGGARVGVNDLAQLRSSVMKLKDRVAQRDQAAATARLLAQTADTAAREAREGANKWKTRVATAEQQVAACSESLLAANTARDDCQRSVNTLLAAKTSELNSLAAAVEAADGVAAGAAKAADRLQSELDYATADIRKQKAAALTQLRAAETRVETVFRPLSQAMHFTAEDVSVVEDALKAAKAAADAAQDKSRGLRSASSTALQAVESLQNLLAIARTR